VKRLLAVVLFVLGFVAAGALSSTVVADITTSTSTTTATTTTETTTPVTTTTTRAATLPARVRVAGVRVGGLAPADAVAAVQEAFRRPLPVVVDRATLLLDPRTVASAYIRTAVARARVAEPGTNVQLFVAPHGADLRAWVQKVENRFERAPVDATVRLVHDKPLLTKDQPGRTIDAARLQMKVSTALRSNSRLPVHVHTRKVPAKVTIAHFAESIVINREQNRLYLYDRATLRRVFPVATGQSIYPTPKGVWHIVVKWRNPWWYPPVNDAWARGLKPVPPGPGNPLGTRWMGLDAPGVGIHGTDDPSSIGYSASHGCIRMQVPDAEWLFDHVSIGTTVYIV
jgi:lipoprotein-anchoring transpeptidase ErfK/SrfK